MRCSYSALTDPSSRPVVCTAGTALHSALMAPAHSPPAEAPGGRERTANLPCFLLPCCAARAGGQQGSRAFAVLLCGESAKTARSDGSHTMRSSTIDASSALRPALWRAKASGDPLMLQRRAQRRASTWQQQSGAHGLPTSSPAVVQRSKHAAAAVARVRVSPFSQRPKGGVGPGARLQAREVKKSLVRAQPVAPNFVSARHEPPHRRRSMGGRGSRADPPTKTSGL